MDRKSSLLGGAAFGVLLAFGVCAAAQAAPASQAAANAEVRSEVEQLKAEVQALEAWKEQQDAQHQQDQQQLNEVKGQLADANARAQAAEAQVQSQIQTIPTQVDAEVAKAKPKTDALYIKGVKVTLGGFVAAETITRDHNMASDISTNFSAIPYPQNIVGHTGETRFTARQSRFTLLAQGDPAPDVHIAGYGEFDFQAAAQTANSNQTNSYNPRIRVLYTTVDWDMSGGGLHFLAGQNWSLATTNAKGILPRTESPPPQIDAQYVPGFVFARQPQVRLAYDWNKQFWVAVSLENPASTFSSQANFFSNVVVQNTSPAGSGFNSANSLSLNRLPDLIGKAAVDETFDGHSFHAEIFGIAREFYARASTSGSGGPFANETASGYGFGGSLVLGAVPQVLDLQLSGADGRGIGRYGASGLPDVAFAPDGTMHPIDEWDLMGGGTLHIGPQLDIYAFGGIESESQTSFDMTSGAVTKHAGLGDLAFDQSGCMIEASSSSTCTNQTHYVDQATVGFWHKPYIGAFGKFQWGVQYSYTERHGFPGNNGLTAAPKATENMVFTSFRYYPF